MAFNILLTRGWILTRLIVARVFTLFQTLIATPQPGQNQVIIAQTLYYFVVTNSDTKSITAGLSAQNPGFPGRYNWRWGG
ncbi:hypothetical protein SAMN05216436_105145 [bacterium A37T11]|nr:hypothetical protein SAMN05216436_105145 [bacterium A37T11]